jgi:hypothetical protein
MGHALQVKDGTGTNYFYEFLEVTLRGTPAGDKWEEILSFVTYFPGRGTVRETAYLEGKAEGKAEGQAEGEAKGLLYVLDVRGIPVPDSVRERISHCTDLELLDRWLERSRTVTQAEDLFTEDSPAPEDAPGQG